MSADKRAQFDKYIRRVGVIYPWHNASVRVLVSESNPTLFDIIKTQHGKRTIASDAHLTLPQAWTKAVELALEIYQTNRDKETGTPRRFIP